MFEDFAPLVWITVLSGITIIGLKVVYLPYRARVKRDKKKAEDAAKGDAVDKIFREYEEVTPEKIMEAKKQLALIKRQNPNGVNLGMQENMLQWAELIMQLKSIPIIGQAVPALKPIVKQFLGGK